MRIFFSKKKRHRNRQHAAIKYPLFIMVRNETNRIESEWRFSYSFWTLVCNSILRLFDWISSNELDPNQDEKTDYDSTGNGLKRMT
jgi:hypothetical protein